MLEYDLTISCIYVIYIRVASKLPAPSNGKMTDSYRVGIRYFSMYFYTPNIAFEVVQAGI